MALWPVIIATTAPMKGKSDQVRIPETKLTTARVLVDDCTVRGALEFSVFINNIGFPKPNNFHKQLICVLCLDGKDLSDQSQNHRDDD